MTLARLLRCQPWGTHGLDFVPDALPQKARWYMPWRFGRWRGTNRGPRRRLPSRTRQVTDGETERAAETTHAYLRSFAGVSRRSKKWSL